MEPLSPELITMLQRPNPAVIGTLRANGSPATVPTWYLWDDGVILLSMDNSRVRLKHVQRNSAIAITVLDDADWYNHVSFQGHVVSLRDDDQLVDIDRLSMHYLGEPYFERDRPRTTARVEPQSWHSWRRGQSLVNE